MLTEAQINDIFFPPITGWLLFFKIFFILDAVAIIAFIIYTWFVTPWLKRLILWDIKEFFTFRPYITRKIDKDWVKILHRLDSDLETEYKLAVIEADLLLDDILKRMGTEGKNLAEKLDKLKPDALSNFLDVRAADQLYQNLVYDPSYRLTLVEAKKIVAVFEKALTDLEAF